MTRPYFYEKQPLWVVLLCTFFISFSTLGSAQNIIYVDFSAPAGENGTSWTNAYNNLQHALNEANSTAGIIDQIWIAEGTYIPSAELFGQMGGNIRDRSFYITEDVEIYGGFPAGGGTFAQRNPVDNPTIISGDIQTTNDISDNTYHLLTTKDLTSATIIEGLIFNHGNANGMGSTIVESVPRNRGGAIYNKNGSSPTIRYCVFNNNQSAAQGGAIYNEAMSTTTLIACVFFNNTATQEGGAIYTQSSTTLTNCVFHSNTASTGSVANLTNAGSTTFTNCTIYSNHTNSTGAAIDNTAGPLTINNSILWANGNAIANGITSTTTIDYSALPPHILQINGVNDGGNNITTYPHFENITTLDLRLRNYSPAINGGNATLNSLPIDIVGNARVQGSQIDIGAYESNTTTPSTIPTIIYVDVNNTSSGVIDGESWNTAYPDLQTALNASSNTQDIWVKEGTYRPTSTPKGLATDNTREQTFYFTTDKKIYGGFSSATTNPTLAQRNSHSYPTILSGDLGDNGLTNDNSYHILTTAFTTSSTLVDGFIFEHGTANGTSAATTLGEINPNKGGAVNMYNASPTFTNCIFRNNQSTVQGGAIYHEGTGGASYTNCLFHDNQAQRGGALAHISTDGATVTNCTFSQNSASNEGGALYASNANTTVTNTILTNNGDEINENGGAVTNVSYSLLPAFVFSTNNATDGGNNIHSSANFVDANNNNFQLTANSLAIDAGNDAANTTPTDLANQTRIYGGNTIDIGAYEFQGNGSATSGTIYVDGALAINGDGSSWANAFNNIQDALNIANINNEIWVATYTYYPTQALQASTDARNKSFYIDGDIKIYGGFQSGDLNLTDRDPIANPTTLSGDLGAMNDNTDNAYHIMATSALSNNAIIDGFIFERGNANSATSTADINNEYGAAMYNSNFSAPRITNCIFKNNESTQRAGAIYNTTDAAPQFLFCQFHDNTSRQGGAIYNEEAGAVTFSNSIFYNNIAFAEMGDFPVVSTGAAIYNDRSNGLQLTNCTVANNFCEGPIKGAIINTGNNTVIIENSILWRNEGEFDNLSGSSSATFKNSIFPRYVLDLNNVSDLGGNIHYGPNFANVNTNDFHLRNYSPAINTGDNALNTATKDIEGNNRIYAATIDIGAYELTSVIPIAAPDRIFVKQDGSDSNSGSSFNNAYANLQTAIDNAGANTKIFVAQGTYTPNTIVPQGDQNDHKSFYLYGDYAIYGGFIGNESSLAERPTNTHSTLDGDNQMHHIMTIIAASENTIIDGFVFQNGNADGSQQNTSLRPEDAGAAVANDIYSKPQFIHCQFNNNTALFAGGAIVNINNSAPLFERSSFDNNTTTSTGGAIENEGNTSFTAINCIFNDNMSADGGAIAISANADASLINCTFDGNNATDDGDVLHSANDANDITFTNCIISNNGIPIDADIVHEEDNSKTILRNCLLPSTLYNDLGSNNLQNGGANIEGSPSYTDPMANTFLLSASSIAIDAGDDNANNTLIDYVGNQRKQRTIDIGANEFQGTPSAPTGVIYVVQNNSAMTIDGTSWTTAFPNIQQALSAATNNQQIWVASGTYTPTSPPSSSMDDRDHTFIMENPAYLYGGFSGTETSLIQRDPNANPTILSGDLGTLGDNNDNAYHILIINTQNPNITVDGFIFEGGNANGTGELNGFERNYGGALYNKGGNYPIANCIFRNNHAERGGAVYNNNSLTTFANCLWHDNSAIAGGGAIQNSGPNKLYNCTITQNTPDAIFNTGATISIQNSIIWDNADQLRSNQPSADYDLSYSIFDDGVVDNIVDTSIYENTGLGVLDLPPLFVDPDNNDFTLQDCSPAIDAGNNSVYDLFKDLANQHRLQNLVMDIGAYEYQSPLSTSSCSADSPIATSAGRHTAVSTNTTPDGWTHYCNCDGELLLSLNIGTTGTEINRYDVSVVIGATPATYYPANTGFITNPNGAVLFNRTWNVNPITQPTSEIPVRFYFSNDEYLAINTNLAAQGQTPLSTINQLWFYKALAGNPHDDIANIDQVQLFANALSASNTTWALGNTMSDYYAEFLVSSFSGGGGGGATNGQDALPVEWLNFHARNSDNGSVVLNWQTATEINNKGFEVLHSTNGRDFTNIGWVEGNNNSQQTSSYSFIHETPAQGINYYQLRQVDFDNNTQLSTMVSVLISNDLQTTVYPNPIGKTDNAHINIKINQPELVTITVTDINGIQRLYQQQLVQYQSNLPLSTTKWPEGVYFIKVQTHNETQVIKIVK